MGLAKTITKQFINMAKDSDRVQLSIDQMKEKLIKESLNIVKSAGIDPSQLPFDPLQLLSGNLPDPQLLLTPENVCSVPPLTNSQKNKANIAIIKSQQQLGAIIENTNKLKSALIAIQTPITAIRVTGEATASFANSLSNIIKIIKAIPIPTAFGAPAVALPVKVLTILSSTLIKLDKKVDIAKGTISLIPPMIKQISGILNQVIKTVSAMEASIQGALILTAFIKSIVELGDFCNVNSDLYIVDGDVSDGNIFALDRIDGLSIGMIVNTVTDGNINSNTSIISITPTNSTVTFSSLNTLSNGTGIIFKSDGSGVSQIDINNVTNNVNGVLQDALNKSGDNVSLLENELSEADLIASFPFFYKGFLLELVNNPDNATFSEDTDPKSKTFGEILRGPDFPFPSRKIRATRDFSNSTENKNTIFVRNNKFNTPIGNIILFNDPGGQGRYSYSSSVSILVAEMKYKIDNYLQGVKELALPAITEADGGRVGKTPTPPNPNPQVFTPPVDLDPGPGGSDDPPSPTGSVDPPLPPAFYFNGLNPFTEVTPTRIIASGSFTVTRPIKIKMTTFGGEAMFSDSTAFLRIYKQTVPGYSYMMEQQYAESMETVTTQDNPQGYYSSDFNPPEYWPITPGYANGSVVTNLGIFRYELELTDYTGAGSNFAKFEIEAQ